MRGSSYIFGLVRSIALISGLVALNVSTMASTPRGSLLTEPTVTKYGSKRKCLAALEAWATRQKSEESAHPTQRPDTWRLEGPRRDYDGSTHYRLTRISADTMGPLEHSTAYIYEHACKGREYSALVDGWVNDDFLPPEIK